MFRAFKTIDFLLCMSFKKVNNRGLKQSLEDKIYTRLGCVCHSKK